MAHPIEDQRDSLRRKIYWILITVGLGAMIGRILAVDSVDLVKLEEHRIRRAIVAKEKGLKSEGFEGKQLKEEMARQEVKIKEYLKLRRPFLSANDRSRWCTVRTLVEPEMRVEGVPYAIDKVIQEPGWDTIDKVKHSGHLYSSKPPLFPTLVAAEYWLIHKLTGADLKTHPYQIAHFMLATVNVIPLVVAFGLLAVLIDRFGTSDWGRIFVMASAVFGTFLTTYAVAINNHIPAAVSVTITVYALVRIWFDDKRNWYYFFIVGLFSAFAVTNELPSLALFAFVAAGLCLKAPRQTLLSFVPGAVLIAAGFFGTNWIAHQDLKPPYMHRSAEDNWYDYTYERNGRQIESYWTNRVGIDLGEPSRAVYAANMLIGHHGVFSLTPIWMLSLAGLFVWLRRCNERRLRELALLIATVSVVCIVFYIMRPEQDRNYGGMTCGFRWLFWFAPLWLIAMLPAVDAMAKYFWTRGLALLLLAFSVLSVSYPTWNPWSSPWLSVFFW